MKKFRTKKKGGEVVEETKGEVDLLGQLEKSQLRAWLESSKEHASGQLEFSYVLCKIIGDITSESLYKNEKIGWRKKYVIMNDDSYHGIEDHEDEELVYSQIIRKVDESRMIVTIPDIKEQVKFADTVVHIGLMNPYDKEDEAVDVLRLSAFRIAQFFIQAESISEDQSIEEDVESIDPLDSLMSYLKGEVSEELRENIDYWSQEFYREEKERQVERKLKRERDMKRNRKRSQSQKKTITRGRG